MWSSLIDKGGESKMGERSKRGERGRPFTGIIDADQVPAMQKVGQEMGLPVKVLAEAGEEYTTLSGKKQVVRNGGAHVQVLGSEPKVGLSNFWNRVKEETAAESAA